MKCPFCSYAETSVVDSRDTDEMQTTRRRRECLKCKKRFTTYEKPEEPDLYIIKKDGRREKFDRAKLKGGILKACEKRPIPVEKIDRFLDEIERLLRKGGKQEVKSVQLGELVSKKLLRLDSVAYIRFTSVYKDFSDITEFKKTIREITAKQK